MFFRFLHFLIYLSTLPFWPVVSRFSHPSAVSHQFCPYFHFSCEPNRKGSYGNYEQPRETRNLAGLPNFGNISQMLRYGLLMFCTVARKSVLSCDQSVLQPFAYLCFCNLHLVLRYAVDASWILSLACTVAPNCQNTSKNAYYGCEKCRKSNPVLFFYNGRKFRRHCVNIETT